MPFIQGIIKKPLTKGLSSVFLKWYQCAMLTPAKKEIKKEIDFLMSNSAS